MTGTPENPTRSMRKLAALVIGTLWLALAVLLGKELQHDPGLGAQY
jgi:hypothetical protein